MSEEQSEKVTFSILRKGLQELERQRNTRASEERNSAIRRVLNVTDGMTADPTQRKALKDLINEAFYGQQFPSMNMNTSLESKLYEALTGGEGLWEEPKANQVVGAQPWNPFEDVVKQ